LAWREWSRGLGELWTTLRPRLTNLPHRVYWDLRDIMRQPRSPQEMGPVRVRVLFVCFGNICRSPLAEEVFRMKLAEKGLAGVVGVDSAATSPWNIGKRPHWKARACAARHGLSLGHLRARMFSAADFESFDQILVMDHRNREDVLRLAPDPGKRARVRMLLDSAGGGEIADPINGGVAEFELVFRQINAACDSLVAEVAREVERSPANPSSLARP
jgi:low molecular weight protein-tyrosine phosphatase